MNKVAVITRTKDRPLFLRRALKSVAAQSFSDYVHVVVNDGGDRAAVEKAVDGLPSKAKDKVTVFHRDKPSGAPDTIFNESIDRVDSEFFAIHDDDDTWHVDFLRLTVDYLDEHPDEAAVVVRTDKIVEAEQDGELVTKKQKPYMSSLGAVSLYRQCIDNQLTPIATLFRRSAYEVVGKFDDSLPVVGDWEFGIRLLQKYDVGYLDAPRALAFYHHRAAGDNSFAKHNHRTYVTKVANAYLRAELKDGKLGVGYIMSKLKYEQDVRHGLVKRIVPMQLLSKFRR